MSNNEHESGSGTPRDPWTSAEPSVTPPAQPEGQWERDLVNRLAFAALNEQRRTRRWSIFFKFLVFAYLFTLLLYIPGEFGGSTFKTGKHTALIDIEGVIAADATANADSIVSGLRAAFEDHSTAAVIIRINSPGGSPVQAGYVYDEVRRLRGKYPEVPVYGVISDICASGGYYIAASTDQIYADKASMVGSIGVLMDGFGFVGTMDKLGVERRLLTAGEHKGFMDPFSPVKDEDVTHIKTLLGEIHEQFKTAVRNGRGKRLQETPELFSGLIWTGEQSVKLGLADGLGNASYVAREIVGVEKIVDFTQRPSYLDRFAEKLGVVMSNVLTSAPSIK